MIEYLRTVLEHAVVGGVFAATGWWVKGLCKHTHHRLIVGGALLLTESSIAVAVIH